MDRLENLPAADHGAAGLYRYTGDDRAFLQARIEEFRDQAARRLAGALTEDEFKPLRLMNGLYLQLHAYMLRVAIPYQNLVLPHVRRADLPALHAALAAQGLATANIGLVGGIIACPGLDYCALANARSIPIAQRISERFAEVASQAELGPVTLNISGCINACAHHHVGNIGILGVEKHGEEAYQLTLGGRADNRAALGRLLGPAFSAEEVVEAVATVLHTYLRLREPGEAFVDAVDRLGLAPFKEAVYAHA